MSTNFQVAFKHHNGNLHVHPRGDLDGSSALELIRLMSRRYNGIGDVVIHTRRLGRVYPFGSFTFQKSVAESGIPTRRISLKGAKGRDLAPKGCRVVDGGRHQCRGNCANCKCLASKRPS